jgi:hypothetical protein
LLCMDQMKLSLNTLDSNLKSLITSCDEIGAMIHRDLFHVEVVSA